MYQNSISHNMNRDISRPSLSRRFVPRVDVVSVGVPNTALTRPWISSAGVTSTLNISSELIVKRKASPRAAGFNVLDISHNSSSTNTVDSPILVENTTLARVCADGLRQFLQVSVAGLNELLLNIGRPSLR